MKTYRKNSKKNPWRNTRNKRDIKWDKILANILIGTIPLMILCLAFNFIIKSADVYQYSLKDSQSLYTINKTVDEKKLVNLIEKFMKGKTDKFQLKESVEYEPENVFSKEDQELAKKVRDVANVSFIVGGVSGLITIGIYFLLIRWRKKEVHMSAYKKSIISLIGLTGITLLSVLIPLFRESIWGGLMGIKINEEDLLFQIFGTTFITQICVFILIATTVVMAILGYITWRIAGKKKLFKRF